MTQLKLIISATLEDNEARTRINNELTESFKISRGLKQGDGLTTHLFDLTLKYAI